MELIRNSAEHHFLMQLADIKKNPSDWQIMYFALSRALPHSDLVAHPAQISNKLARQNLKAQSVIEPLSESLAPRAEALIYHFADHDVAALVKIRNEEDQNYCHTLFSKISRIIPPVYVDMGALKNELYQYGKLADEKFLSEKRIRAYRALADDHKCGSLPVRRAQRNDPVVLIVEDDRFTASYTSNILSKEYDLIIARNGEEAITLYLEHAPDILFLDIHLPGISGHETLQAIRAMDPQAYVVMLSVDTAKANIMQANAFGAQNFLKKPFSKERLINTVRGSPYVRGIFDPIFHEHGRKIMQDTVS